MITSESVTSLVPALLKAKKEFAPALKTAVNPHFKSKYVDLASVIEATEAALTANGLVLIQGAEDGGTVPVVTIVTRIFHHSGEWIESSLTLPAGTPARYDAQTVGSAITYGRRYAHMAILGIAGEDDDGSAASGKNGAEATSVPSELKDKMAAQERAFSSGPARESQLTRQLKASIEQQKAQKATQSSLEITDDDFPGDLPGEMFAEEPWRPQLVDQQPASKPVPVKPPVGPFISEPQSKRFYAIAMGAGKTKEDITEALAMIGATSSTQIPRVKYESFCDWAKR